MLGLAIICQLRALSLAPLIVVQPLGAIALVITTLLNARDQRGQAHPPVDRRDLACVGGIFVFVTIAALFATENPLRTSARLVTILLLLGGVIIVFTGLWIWLRSADRALFYILAAGVLYGFVATLAKVVISRIQAGDFDWLTMLCLVALIAGRRVGAYFVQTAYSSGPPDLVIAGLTVIDPIVAILIGLIVLQEAADAPLWVFIAFGVAGAIAMWGLPPRPVPPADRAQQSGTAHRAGEQRRRLDRTTERVDARASALVRRG